MEKRQSEDQKDRKKQRNDRTEQEQSETKRADRTEEISSTEFPEGGDTIYTEKENPRHPNGGLFSNVDINSLMK